MSDSSPPGFNFNLGLTLEIEVSGKTAKIQSGNIERLNLSLLPYGHLCKVQFSAFGDEWDPLFKSHEVTKATLTFNGVDPVSMKENGPPVLVLKGIVTNKCGQGMQSSSGDQKMPLRVYTIAFTDHAKATWDQHFPIKMYVDQSMKDVIEKNANPEVSIKYDWDKLETKHPIIAFSLERKNWLPKDQQVSFYSFLTWYLQKENGIWAYDYKAHTYSIIGKKAKAGKSFAIVEELVNPPNCLFPETIRYNTKELKHTFDSSEGEVKENPDAFKAVNRESISSDNYRCYPEQAHETIQSVLEPEKNVIEVEFHAMKDKDKQKLLLDKLIPGSTVSFTGNNGGHWSSDATYKGKTFRIRGLYIRATKWDDSQIEPQPVKMYQLHVKLILEEEEETFVPRPAFIPPSYPFAIQGTIFSDIGDEEQSTYKILESEKAPQGQYLVKVPLVEDDKKVVVPFTPDFISGQFYFPYTKGQRVELSMYLHTAKILRPSDWQALARLPMGIQGNQIVFASNGKDKYVIIRHEFKDGKDPILTIKQSSSETQTQAIQIKEKDMLIMLDEKDKKTLSIHMNNDSGLTLSLEDKSAGNTQQIILDGKTMTSIFKGGDGESKIVQKADSISVDCKTLNLNVEEFLLNAKNNISGVAKNKVTWEGKVYHAAVSSAKLGR